jgi:hypothetical protein
MRRGRKSIGEGEQWIENRRRESEGGKIGIRK